MSVSRVRVAFSTKTLYTIIQQRQEDEIIIPDHQREYCWNESRKDKFVQSILRGFPCPAILLGEHRIDKPTLEDGNQRITTAMKYRKDEFASNGKLFSQLSVREQDWFDNYPISVVSYSNATQEDRIQIFDWHQNGAPLSTGERFHAHASTPLIKFVKDTLFTPGIGLHDRAVPIWGARNGTDKRRKWLQDAVALVTGLAHGAFHMTKVYDRMIANNFLTKAFDADGVARDLQRILEIFEGADAVQRVQGWNARHWDAGNFVGYIAYSFSHKARVAYEETQASVPVAERVPYDDGKHRPNSMTPAEWTRLKTGWVNYICKIRRDVSRPFKTLLERDIHRDLNNGRNWSLSRWRAGYLRVFEPDVVQEVFEEEESSEEE
jgi:hypothetical protein